jgi:hypothetical protein
LVQFKETLALGVKLPAVEEVVFQLGHIGPTVAAPSG